MAADGWRRSGSADCERPRVNSSSGTANRSLEPCWTRCTADRIVIPSRSVPMRVDFEWEAVKADANARKHRVGFEEALTEFADPLARLFDDPDHSAREQREIIVGHSTQQRLLLVSFTERDARIRIVSARAATKRERHDYEHHTTPNHSDVSDGLRSEYDLDYGQSRRNRFASRMSGTTLAVVLEPDVAKVFDSSEAVNRLLRSVISALPSPPSRSVSGKS